MVYDILVDARRTIMTMFILSIDGQRYLRWSLPAALASIAFVRLDSTPHVVTLKRLVLA